MQDKILRKLFLGFIQIHILHHAKEDPFYGAWIEGKIRKYYNTTELGNEVLEEARNKAYELFKEIKEWSENISGIFVFQEIKYKDILDKMLKSFM